MRKFVLHFQPSDPTRFLTSPTFPRGEVQDLSPQRFDFRAIESLQGVKARPSADP